MTDVIYDFLSQGVDMIISGAILAGIVVLLRASTILSNYSANQQATADRLNYYREYNIYDQGEHLSCADAISCLMYYRFSIDVVIECSNTRSVVNPSTGLLVDVTTVDRYYNDKSTGVFYRESEGVQESITYDALKSDIGSSRIFNSMIYENGSSDPSLSGYTGGVITGIKFEQN